MIPNIDKKNIILKNKETRFCSVNKLAINIPEATKTETKIITKRSKNSIMVYC